MRESLKQILEPEQTQKYVLKKYFSKISIVFIREIEFLASTFIKNLDYIQERSLTLPFAKNFIEYLKKSANEEEKVS